MSMAPPTAELAELTEQERLRLGVIPELGQLGLGPVAERDLREVPGGQRARMPTTIDRTAAATAGRRRRARAGGGTPRAARGRTPAGDRRTNGPGPPPARRRGGSGRRGRAPGSGTGSTAGPARDRPGTTGSASRDLAAATGRTPRQADEAGEAPHGVDRGSVRRGPRAGPPPARTRRRGAGRPRRGSASSRVGDGQEPLGGHVGQRPPGVASGRSSPPVAASRPTG